MNNRCGGPSPRAKLSGVLNLVELDLRHREVLAVVGEKSAAVFNGNSGDDGIGQSQRAPLACPGTLEVTGQPRCAFVQFETLKSASAKRKILIITTVGDSPESWDRRIMRIAADAAGVVDLLVLVGKKKDTKRAGKAASDHGLLPEGLHQFEDVRDVARFLQSTLRFGDLVLLRGRTSDHMARVYHSQLRDVACWKSDCQKTSLCDHCPELFGDGKLVEAGS